MHGDNMRIMGWVGSAVLVGWLGCGPSLEDSIDKLGGSPEEQAAGRMALLLAKDRAVDDLLQALDDPVRATSRRGLVEVLVGLMNRVDDERIEVAVLRVLRDDPDYRVRATVAQQLGLHRPAHFIEPFLGALADTSGAVCHAALLALGKVESDLDAGQRERLQQGARRLTAHGHHGARLEATIRVENFVSGCSTIRRRWCGCAAIGRRRLGRGFSKWVRGTGARIRGMRSTMKADPRPEA